MMYEEFTALLMENGVAENEWPDVDVYHDGIEPVYNYHPAFAGSFGKAKCAKLYAAGGIGVFCAMAKEAHEAKDIEETVRMLREKCDRVQQEYDEACKQYTEYCRNTMQMWRVE